MEAEEYNEVQELDVRDVELAADRLKNVIHNIPVSHSRTFSEMSGATIYLKEENRQKTGSFKVRGAYNKMAALIERGEKPKHVVASSAGNHAQGVAYAASSLGIKSTIVMPQSTPIAKISATEGYKAKVVLHGDCYDDAYSKAMMICEKQDATFIHPFDDPDVVAGQGTIALEVLRDIPLVDTVLIPAGGGGLLAGMACCIKKINPRVQVIGVQAAGADAIVKSFAQKQLVELDQIHTIADGIAVKKPGKFTVAQINRYVDQMVTVPDEDIASTILLLLERSKLVVEPAGAISLAAALSGAVDIKGKKAVCVLSGGNIDVGFIHRIVERGLVTRGRQIRVRSVMLDKPGSLELFSNIVASTGANIIRVQYDRLNASLQLDEAILHTTCEVSGKEHGQVLLKELEINGFFSEIE